MHGATGHTVRKLRDFDLSVVKCVAPDIVILETGTNNLVDRSPEVAGYDIEDLVRLFRSRCWRLSRYSTWCVFLLGFIVRFPRSGSKSVFIVLDPFPNVFLLGPSRFFLTQVKNCIW